MSRPPPRHRVVVLPWLRRPGRLLLRDWLAITLGPLVLAWRPLAGPELEHELEHVRQWGRHGALFAGRYLLESLRSWRAGRGWYAGNRFEVAAREAALRAGRRPATDAPRGRCSRLGRPSPSAACPAEGRSHPRA